VRFHSLDLLNNIVRKPSLYLLGADARE